MFLCGPGKKEKSADPINVARTLLARVMDNFDRGYLDPAQRSSVFGTDDKQCANI